MDRGFIKLSETQAEIGQLAEQMVMVGVSSSQIVTGTKFEDHLDAFNSGDRLYVLCVSDLCRSMSQLLGLCKTLSQRDIQIISLAEPWFNTSVQSVDPSEFLSHLNDLAHHLITKSTKTGLEKARLSGKKLGRPQGKATRVSQKIVLCATLYQNSNISLKKICEMMDCTPHAFYRYAIDNNIPLRREIQP